MDKNYDGMAGVMHELLHDVARLLAAWLRTHLPGDDADWWQKRVIPSMTHAQSRHAETQRFNTLDALDLGALLRVLNYNWHDLVNRTGIDRHHRHYAQEMIALRNRWAHASPKGVGQDILYRDLDTIQRLAELLDAPPGIGDKAAAAKQRVFTNETSAPANDASPEIALPENQPLDPESIRINSMVFVKSDPARRGVVTGIAGARETTRYQVFLDNKIQQFYADQIALVPQDQPGPTLSIEALHAFLTAMHLRHPSLNTLYSFNAARIDFVPYQYRPAMKIIRADRPRLLIADGVGVGKTIEAGLILRELQARGAVERVLIICPKPLVAERKWELEMKRFDERFLPLDSATLRYCIEETDKEGEWPERHAKAILPYSLFDEKLLEGEKTKRRRRLGLTELDPPPRFDLVIVDEAHHIRNESTYAHQCARYFCDAADAVVFLSATPVQLHNSELFTLLNTLRPDLIVDEAAFERMAEPNPAVNCALRHARAGGDSWREDARAALEVAAQCARGAITLRPDPEFNAVLRDLERPDITREERVALVNRIENFNSFANLINRTRRRDIGDFCVRKPVTVEVAHTPEQRRLHDAMIALTEKSLALRHNPVLIHFMTTTIRRQAASCLYGLAPQLRGLIEGRLDDYDPLDYRGGNEIEMTAFDETLRGEAEDIAVMAEKLPLQDPKFDALIEIVRQKQQQPNNKVLVFSTFRHTLAYLDLRLEAAGVRVALVHGDVPDETRQRTRKRFEESRDSEDAVDVLLMSEVGCEGLDYQFCDTMINYDLPWNPMRIEQRIGRIDRRGQQSETVAIYNLITSDTIDADIYHRCLWRIGVFEESLGDCEEILGDIQQRIEDIARNRQLSPDEKRRKLEQLADNEQRRAIEMRELENKEAEFFGLRLPRDRADAEVYDAENRWLTPAALEGFVSRYIEQRTGTREPFIGKGPLKSLRLDHDARKTLLEEFKKLGATKNERNRAWARYLKGSEPHCPVTFDCACAADNRDALFIMPLHPLVSQAVAACAPPLPARTVLTVQAQGMPAGVHPFVLYAWEYKGARPDLKLVPCCDDETLRKDFFPLLEAAAPGNADIAPEHEAAFEQLDALHYQAFQQARETHRNNTRQRAAMQRDSLETSFRNFESILRERIENATEPKIIRMLQQQLTNRSADHQRRLDDINQAETTADILANPVLQGLMIINEQEERSND